MDYTKRVPGAARTDCTIADVAGLAGVSTATVSRVLSGTAHASDDVRNRVREAVRALNYRPNRLARNLRLRGIRAVGLLIPDIENPFYTSVTRGIEDVLQAADYSLLLTNSNDEPARERRCVETLRAEGVAGIIFSSCLSQMDEYRQMLESNMALVSVSRIPPGLNVDMVTVSELEGARMAVAHLVDLRHKRIALINGPAGLSTAREREAGYRAALQEAGLPFRPELVLHTDFRQNGGYRSMQDLMSQPSRPSAVFVASNLMTLGALQAIHESGLEIPKDIAVVGFDDMPWAISLKPPLTAVAQPGFDVGATAARLLLDRIHSPNRPFRRMMLETRLVVRASSGMAASKPDLAVPIGSQ